MKFYFGRQTGYQVRVGKAVDRCSPILAAEPGYFYLGFTFDNTVSKMDLDFKIKRADLNFMIERVNDTEREEEDK